VKLPKRLLAIAGVATGAAIPLVFAASAANAAPSTVKVVTHLSNRADTAPSGIVWASDNISRQFTLINNGGGHYTVNVTDNGSFTANTDPGTGAPINATGSLTGTETWDVTGVNSVNANALSSQTPSTVSTSTMIEEMLPGASDISTNITSYTFTYRSDNGSTYSQVQPLNGGFFVQGDITG
jgi:hypothetical protein